MPHVGTAIIEDAIAKEVACLYRVIVCVEAKKEAGELADVFMEHYLDVVVELVAAGRRVHNDDGTRGILLF